MMKALGPTDILSFQKPGDVLARPHPNCYWLLPGRIIAGEYPRNADEKSSLAKLETILAAGVTRVVDLTEPHELEPYTVLMQSEAVRQGVVATHMRHPIRDLRVPNVATMRAILDAIAANDAGVTYVHCWGGVGRTGTVAGCLLVEVGFTAEAAIAILAGARRLKSGPRHTAPMTRTSKVTFSQSLMAEKIAAKLSMLGLPFGDSMRCKLLLGLWVSSARCSNPTVALTRSRRMRRAASGSPLRNSVAASSSSALANAGSRLTRSTTVCLKSRVRVMGSFLS